jgi:hypothetical protein
MFSDQEFHMHFFRNPKLEALSLPEPRAQEQDVSGFLWAPEVAASDASIVAAMMAG